MHCVCVGGDGDGVCASGVCMYGGCICGICVCGACVSVCLDDCMIVVSFDVCLVCVYVYAHLMSDTSDM